MSDLQLLIEEIARIALEDQAMRARIGKELDSSDSELDKVSDYLESHLNPDSWNKAWTDWANTSSVTRI